MLQGASFIIDFHNFGYSLLALKTCRPFSFILPHTIRLGASLQLGPGWEPNIRLSRTLPEPSWAQAWVCSAQAHRIYEQLCGQLADDAFCVTAQRGP